MPRILKVSKEKQLTHSNSRSDRAMNKNMENVSDRELFSELFDNPINPLHVHIVPPFVDENNQMFYIQLNGEVAFKWREVCSQPCKVFNLLQRSILPLGYHLTASAEERVGKALSESIRRFWRKIQATKDGKKRKHLKSGTWLKLAIKPEEFAQTPNDALADMVNVEEKAARLYEEMQLNLAHFGKNYIDVSNRQKYRHLAEIK